MPNSGLNPRQRQFVNHLAKGMPASRAYTAAGYKTNARVPDSAASLLARNPKIVAALSEIQKQSAKRVAKTVDDVIADLYVLRDQAVALGQIGAGVAAVMGAAKILGFVVDRAQIQGDLNLIPKPALAPTKEILLSPSEWVRQWSQGTNGHVDNGQINGNGNSKMNGTEVHDVAVDANEERPPPGQSVYD